MIERVVDAQLARALDGQAPRPGKVSVAEVVLTTARARLSKVRGPPGAAEALLLLAKRAALRAVNRRDKHRLRSHEARELRANPAHLGLQAVVEHVADHGHAALHPLP